MIQRDPCRAQAGTRGRRANPLGVGMRQFGRKGRLVGLALAALLCSSTSAGAQKVTWVSSIVDSPHGVTRAAAVAPLPLRPVTGEPERLALVS